MKSDLFISPEPPATPARGRPRSTSRESVAHVALELFLERGFDETTVDDIGTALGVARRTVFRYYASKNDIVWGDFDGVLARLQRDLESQADDVATINAIAAAVVSSNQYPPEQQLELQERMTLITTVPALQAHSMLRYAAWRAVVASYVARRRGEHEEDPIPQTIAFVSLATCISAFTAWLRLGGDLEDHLNAGFEALKTGFRSA